MTGEISLRKPREVELYYAGKPITPGQIFKTFYGGLDTLIGHNSSNQSTRLDTDASIREAIKHKALSYNRKWQAETKDMVVSARIRFDDLSEKAYSLRPRTNFDPSGIFKAPNIAYLTDEAGNTAILREARVHDPSIVFPRMFQFFGNKFDRSAAAPFYDANARTISPPKKVGAVSYLPEPQLLAAMEALYANAAIPRITPNIQVIGSDAQNLWYLRDMRQIASDISLAPDKLGTYTGILQSLGLMEIVDARQLVHYYYSENGAIGNYDFDFIAHSENPKLVRHREFEDIGRVLKSEGTEHKIFERPDTFTRDVMRTADKVVAANAKQGITPKTIYSTIKPNIDLSTFNKLEVGDLY